VRSAHAARKPSPQPVQRRHRPGPPSFQQEGFCFSIRFNAALKRRSSTLFHLCLDGDASAQTGRHVAGFFGSRFAAAEQVPRHSASLRTRDVCGGAGRAEEERPSWPRFGYRYEIVIPPFLVTRKRISSSRQRQVTVRCESSIHATSSRCSSNAVKTRSSELSYFSPVRCSVSQVAFLVVAPQPT